MKRGSRECVTLVVSITSIVFTLLCTSLYINVVIAEASSSLKSPRLPTLSIDTSSLTIGGISSGADFSVIFHIAYSSLFKGACIYAGQPYRCAVVRFSGDEVIPCSSTTWANLGPGCRGAGYPNYTQASCDPPCDTDWGLLFDKCKGCTSESKKERTVSIVDIERLVEITNREFVLGNIDDPIFLKRQRVYLYRGTHDTCYELDAVNHTAQFYRNFTLNNSDVVYSDAIPSLHSLPSLRYGTPCGTEGNYTISSPHGLELCNYDGGGECLQHVYNNSLISPYSSSTLSSMHRPSSITRHSSSTSSLPPYIYAFDQTEFFSMEDPTPGLDDTGYVFIPPQCLPSASLELRCKLHFFFHGCGMSYISGPGFLFTYIQYSGFNEWALLNNIVIMYPQMGGVSDGSGTAQQQGACWDGYGYTGEEFSSREGVQPRVIRAMLARLARV